MKFEKVLVDTAKTLADVDVGGSKRDPDLAALDCGILQVALMIAGLDGTILPAEYEAFAELARRSRGTSAKNVRLLYDLAVGKASLLAGMARAGVYSETDRLSMFVRLSTESLPKGFAHGSAADLRRAFVLWIAMGLSDGAFSGFERKAVKTLVHRFALLRAKKAGKFTALLETDFFAKVEKLLGEMQLPARRAKAEAALDELISTVEIKGKGFRASKRISLACPAAGPTITGWK